MARSCCLKVWDCEQDLKLLAHEEKNFAAIKTQFVKRGDVFKVLAKRVYKSLNVLWYSGKTMDDRDPRKAKCFDTVTLISYSWMYNEQSLLKDMEVLSNYPVGLRLVLLKIMARVSATDANNHFMIWDTDCATKIKNAFKEIIPRASRLLDCEWIFRYSCYLGKANDILSDSEKHIDAFFRQTFSCPPEEVAVDYSALRENTKPPHEAAFSHVAQLISSHFLDLDRSPPEVLNLKVVKPVVGGNNPAKIAPNQDTICRQVDQKIVDATDSVALTIERVVAGCSLTIDKPECIDLTGSPPQGHSTAEPPGLQRKRQVVQGGSAQPMVLKTLLTKGIVKKPIILSAKKDNSIAQGFLAGEPEPTAATPTSQGVAVVPNESDRASVAVPVRRPIVQRFLYMRPQKPNTESNELAANQLRLGFAAEGAVNGKGALFERFYRPNESSENQRKQFDGLLPESATGAGTSRKEGIANGEGCCRLKTLGRCTGHVVHLQPQTGVVKAVASPADANSTTAKKILDGNKTAKPKKPSKVGGAVNKTDAFKFAGNAAVRRRFVANGRKPFKEILPALQKNVDVEAGKPSRLPASPGGIRVSKMDYRFKPYKLELHRGDTEMGKATGGGVPATATKKYDFRLRVRDGRDGNDGRMLEQGLLQPAIKMRKDLFGKQEASK